MGFDLMFSIVPVFIFIIFAIVIVGIITTAVRGVSQWSRNNASPRLTVEAAVVGKRIDVTHHQHANAGDQTGAHGYHTTSSTSYYVTFQVEKIGRASCRERV